MVLELLGPVSYYKVCLVQYLKDEDDDLVSPPNTKGNQWLKFLQESSHLKGSLGDEVHKT